MTATEMGYEFDVGYDRITNFDAPGYVPKEKSVFLTKAQEELVLDIYEGNAFKEKGKRILDRLKTSTEITSGFMSNGPYTNSRGAFLPEVTGPPVREPIGVINEVAILTTNASHFYASTVFNDVRVKPVDDDYYHLNINNPYKKPSHKQIWRIDYGSANRSKLVYILEENTTLTTIRIFYYIKPTPIIIHDANYVASDGTIDGVDLNASHTVDDLDCILNKIVHREIVNRAVKLGFAALQDEKGFQISSMQEQQ